MSQKNPEQLLQEVKEMATPLHAWLQKNFHPHAAIIIDYDGVKVVEVNMFNPIPVRYDTIKVYRVENEAQQKGLWRKFDGTWEPLFDMLTDGLCRDMPMEDSPLYRTDGKRWFASAPSRETLQKWFSKRDLEELLAAGFTISEFEIDDWIVVSEYEYIFTRDHIISQNAITVQDIYPE